MDAPTLIGLASAALAVFAAILRWLLTSYIKQSKELEEVRQSSVKHTVEALEKTTSSLIVDLRLLRTDVGKLDKTMAVNSTKVKEMSDKVEMLRDLVKAISDGFARRAGAPLEEMPIIGTGMAKLHKKDKP